MGKIKQGILGGFSGKVANVVGSSWKGIAVMKSLPLSVANPKTAAQIAQRTKFANVTAFASSILSTIIKPLWDRFAQKMSGFNEFVQTNIDLFASELPSTFADLIISKGKISYTGHVEFFCQDGPSIIGMDFQYLVKGKYALDTDKVFLVVIDIEGDKTYSGENEYPFSGGAPTIQLDRQAQVGDVFHVYMATQRIDGTIVSDTFYATGAYEI